MLDLIQVLESTTISDFCTRSYPVWELIGNIVLVLRIAIPIIIVLLGTIDLGKAVIAGEDKQIKEAQHMFLRRLIYGIAVFFVIFLVQAVFRLLGTRDTSTGPCFNAMAGIPEPSSSN